MLKYDKTISPFHLQFEYEIWENIILLVSKHDAIRAVMAQSV
jgi:hypothetical protein